MGNRLGKIGHCFAGNGREISRRHEITAILADSLHKGLGHSFCYIRPYPPGHYSSKVHSLSHAAKTMTFSSSISGASVSANATTPPSTAVVEYSAALDPAATFESSGSFASLPLQPVPRGASLSGSGVIPSSCPIERGFLSGPIERGFLSGPMEKTGDDDQPRWNSSHTSSSDNSKASPNRKHLTFMRSFKRAISNKIKGFVLEKETPNDSNQVGGGNTNLSSKISLSCNDHDHDDGYNGDDDGDFLSKSQSLQWAQGKAGEDRTHIVISEEKGWVFVGIYDGFNGPDAPDHLVSNLYNAVHEQIKGLWNGEFGSEEAWNSTNGMEKGNCRLGCWNSNTQSHRKKSKKWNCECYREGVELDGKLKKSNAVESEINHSDVFEALSKALSRTEDAYLEEADARVKENPELALMGSCVLVMLMKGEDVYLMNVGDSRAVLAQKDDLFPTLASLQLTLDHSTYVEEEVERIRKEHPDDDAAVLNDRVKGYLKVTRAFGAGFLKQPKWNDELLEMFRIDYVGTSPYLTCQPSLNHHKLSAKDRFLILSSDGLYQYFTNDEAVSEVELFITLFPEGDPAQHLIEELLFRAAKKAGMDFHELLDIPQGERRRYHDDVSVIVISFQGKVWRSSV